MTANTSSLQRMEGALHRAAQYVAAAGIAYLPKEADDGHTTLTWDEASQCMLGRSLPAAGGIAFAVDLPAYALTCRDPRGADDHALDLAGNPHDEVVAWIRRSLSAQGADAESYQFRFHYTLPSHTEEGSFPSADSDSLARLARLRTESHRAMGEVLAEHPDTDPARIWPHHFDSGALITLARTAERVPAATIGLGLATPDDIVPVHYLYVNQWQSSGTVDPATLPPLEHGRWISGDWKGAVIEAEGLGPNDAAAFFREAAAALR